jgi:thioredoxin reductase
MKEVILCKGGEVVLKGLNKSWFESILLREMRARLKKYGNFTVRLAQSAVSAEPLDEDCDIEGAYEEVKKIFGFVGVSRAAAVEKDIDAILSAGVEVKLNYDVSTKEAMEDLRDNYDATYISIGSHNAKNLGIPGEFAKGVIPAVEMLRGIGDDAMPDFKDKSVAVIGGGNVAMDVARTAKRLGASEVTIVYRRRRVDMTALPDEVAGAVAEGCELVQLKAPARIDTDKHGNVTALWAKPQIVGMADESGRPRPLDANGPEEKIPCQIIISAIGQATDIRFFEEFGIPVFRGNIKAEASSVVDEIPGTYAGGDCVTGPSTVINAVAAGKVAAANIDTYLGYHHEMSVDIDIPLPDHQDDIPYGRVELKERFARVRGNDFDAVEEPMSFEEAMQECSRCLRRDYHGYGAFRGGREERW